MHYESHKTTRKRAHCEGSSQPEISGSLSQKTTQTEEAIFFCGLLTKTHKIALFLDPKKRLLNGVPVSEKFAVPSRKFFWY